MTLFLYRQAQQAILNLKASKLRSCLAILGILVGTAAIVALISCSQLATEKALAQFRSLGTNLIAVSVFQETTKGKNTGINTISISAWRKLPTKVSSVRNVAPYATAYQPMSFAGNNITGVVIGADEALASIIRINLAEGHFVSFVESFEHYCVIGDGLAQQLHRFSLDDPLGKQLRIGQALYTIIGVASHWTENGFFNEDINQAVIIPIAGIALVNKDAKINNAIVLLKPNSNIDAVIDQIKRFTHHQAPKLGVFVRSAKQIITSMESQGHIFTLLLGVIGGISLLVGGIGVMNVMLMSVSERKKEIGIRKAIGAKNTDIQILFLIESILLAMLGGILGIVIGVLFTWVVAYFSHWPFTMYIRPLLVGFVVSVTTGIFFGFYPAHRAARMQPITALRIE
ncbi:MAG: ABC transporter permease [Legionellaceae bacterium]|nr:ABC transporter permease [Legionellaceae bacterium]